MSFWQNLTMIGIFVLQFTRTTFAAPKQASENMDNLPSLSFSALMLAFKCMIGYMGAYLIELKSNDGIGTHQHGLLQFAMITYLILCVIPRLIPDQFRAYKALCHATPVSWKLLFAVFILPLCLVAIVHNPTYLFLAFCLLGLTLGFWLALVLPVMLWGEQV